MGSYVVTSAVSAAIVALLIASLSRPLSAGAPPAPQQARLLTDFTASSPDLGWTIVNDNVMGGRSLGRFDRAPGTLRFTFTTNTNGGGFSSIRTRPVDLDLSTYEGIRVRVRADGGSTSGCSTPARAGVARRSTTGPSSTR
jgi:hypothetical protein